MVRQLRAVIGGVEELMQRSKGVGSEKWCVCVDDLVLCFYYWKA